MADFSHLSKTNQAQMVDVSDKTNTQRSATVANSVNVSVACAEKLTPEMTREIGSTARVAAVFAAKKTSETIPMCHPVPLTGCDVDIEFAANPAAFLIKCSARTNSNTGVEMEAFCAASAAALTIYDMIKAVDPAATIGPMKLLEKRGGKAGVWNP